MTSILSEQSTQPSPQLLSVGEKDSRRLLEVYVKRSLSLNDGSQCHRTLEQRSHKWVTIAERKKRDRKHSSDTSLHLSLENSIVDEDVGQEAFAASEPEKKDETLSEKKYKKWKIKGSVRHNEGSNVSQKSNSKPKKWFQLDKGKEHDGQTHEVLPLSTNTAGDAHTKRSDKLEPSSEERKPKDGKKSKKPTVWKSFLNWFSKGNQEKEQDLPTDEEILPVSGPSTQQISCLPLPETLSKNDTRRSKNMKKKQSRRSAKWRRSGDMSTGKFIEVEPTNCYYEKVSEELEKIVHEVKDGPVDGNAAFQPAGQNVSEDYRDVIKRITELIKQEGDSIDDKLKDNIVVSTFLESISYRSFQQMADQYVQSKVPDKKTQRPVAAPELVKFAFTLDFTARVANIHRQATGQIMGFGNQYIQDRFTHMSESHPHLNDTKTDGHKTETFDFSSI